MTNGFPRWFRLLFTVVMIALCTVMVTQLIQQQRAADLILDLEGKIDNAGKRLAKQQLEYDQALAELPLVLSDLETAAPQAEATAAQVTELKARRNALRTENAALAAQVAELESQLSLTGDPAAAEQQVDQALTLLIEAQDALHTEPTE